MPHKLGILRKLHFMIAFVLARTVFTRSETKHGTTMFVNWCVDKISDIFPEEEPSHPYIIISTCRMPSLNEFLYYRWDDKYVETSDFKHVSHYSPHSFLIIFENVANHDDARLFKHFYERLQVSAAQVRLYRFHSETLHFYTHEPKLVVNGFKIEFLRNRWNLDEIIFKSNTHGAKEYFNYHGQYPISIQRLDEKFRFNNISDILPIFYNIYSGYMQTCLHNSIYEKLASLTFNFNAYDRLFCDAFEYHGLEKSVTTHYDLGDIYYLRHVLLRDGLLSLFPPDTSNVVYYASPKRTFVVLNKNPDTWKFVIRPFTRYAWLFLFVIVGSLTAAHHLREFLSWIYQDNQVAPKSLVVTFNEAGEIVIGKDGDTFDKYESVYEHYLDLTTGIFRILITSAYGGMILVGILKPLYPWTPSTFKELNHTADYFVAVGEHAPPFILEQLRVDHVLNGIKEDMIQNRMMETPADYLVYAMTGTKDGKDFKKYAVIMFDDKINLWIKGRLFIWQTGPILKKIKVASEEILPEIRYVSVAPGATRLHFLVNTIRKVYTSGTWMRWWKLEENYYTLVAPVVAANKIKDLGLKEYPDVHESRPLALHDMFSVFAIEGLCMSFAVGMYIVENIWINCQRLEASSIQII